jgi:Fe-S-cluster containining protein
MGKTSRKTASCTRCGTCCTKGGPSLHVEDRKIIAAGHIRIEHLITIREGELARIPDREGLHPTGQEIVKIAGKGGSWECLFLDKKGSSCKIYEYRPLECRMLKCWDTAELLSVVDKNLLKRSDIIDPEDPILKLVQDHEKRCVIREMESMLSSLSDKDENSTSLRELERLVREDMAFRAEAVSRFNLPLSVELFVFGRPLFKLLSCRGVSVQEECGELRLYA